MYAAQDKQKPIAIVFPIEAALKQIASDNGFQGHGLEDLCHNDKVHAVVLKEMQDVGRKGGLASFEIIDGVVLTDEEWTPQNVSILPVDVWDTLLLTRSIGPCHIGAEAESQGPGGEVQEGDRQGL